MALSVSAFFLSCEAFFFALSLPFSSEKMDI